MQEHKSFRRHRFCLLACLAAGSSASQAQQYVYAVNFECGFQSSADGSDGYEPVVKVANYALKLDLFNPGTV